MYFRRVGVYWWHLPALQRRFKTALTAAGYRVERVNPKRTIEQCHICDELTSVGDNTISCTTKDCPVDTVYRDRSTAVSIAKLIVG